jgi:hypothetical protein
MLVFHVYSENGFVTGGIWRGNKASLYEAYKAFYVLHHFI